MWPCSRHEARLGKSLASCPLTNAMINCRMKAHLLGNRGYGVVVDASPPLPCPMQAAWPPKTRNCTTRRHILRCVAAVISAPGADITVHRREDILIFAAPISMLFCRVLAKYRKADRCYCLGRGNTPADEQIMHEVFRCTTTYTVGEGGRAGNRAAVHRRDSVRRTRATRRSRRDR